MKKILSCCPVVNKEVRSLVPSDFQFQPGKPVSAFVANIYWLQESETTVSIGSEVEDTHCFGTFDDRDGYLSSIEHAYRQGKQIINAYDLGAFTSECLKITTDIIQTPVFELFSHEVKFSWGKEGNWRQYESIADDWNELEHNNKPLSSKNILKPMKRKILLHKHTVFSSKVSCNQQLNLIEKFKEKWNVTSEDKPNYSKRRK
jgi:hypothetical protein